MFYLLLAIISSACVSIVMRFSVNKVKNNITMLATGYFSCTILSVLYASGSFSGLSGINSFPTVILGIAGGILLLAGFIFLQLNVKINGVVLSSIFAKLGVIVPTFIAVIFFREKPGIVQIAGFILAMLAIILINADKKSDKVNSFLMLIFLLLSNGFADSMAKFFKEFGNHNLEEFYFIFTFAVAFILSTLLAILKGQKIKFSDLYCGLLIGIPNYYSIRFLTKAVMEVPSFIAYPTYSVATILLITMAGLFVFKEKLTKNQKYSLLIIIISLILLNI